ncbi:nucleotide exchange factor GrpE [Aquihabitans sp. G128]|uniref:nucleotide exchange factor GrpE n=1 Tax=Aquihabitans sp. G128 TaxID=2849779 RepID=UPI001C221BD1|nr:nucleotide exchange factor GrpE [Aquihabitans sp. G128]QXC59929.1 nucleotide exchange factor GrpE [Aquihabitans sp. G128]
MTDPSANDPVVEAEEVEDPLGPPAAADGPAGGADDAPVDGEVPADGAADRSGASVEELIALLEQTTAERDDYLDKWRRNQADFENSRKRLAKEAIDAGTRAAEALVDKLLPVLDACDGAVAHGAAEVEPIFAALLGTLEKEGLVRINPAGEEFDPNVAEAVLHEPAQDGDDGTVVSDVLRPGYSWKGRVVRPAMVKVRG